MSSKAKGNGKAKQKKDRPGVQVVLRVPAGLKALLQQEAKRCGLSMNAMACARIATGKWITKKEEK